MEFIQTLKSRNEVLFWFGLSCLIAALVFIVLTRVSSIQVVGVNAWYKPFKFALSTAILVWSLAWFSAYLPTSNLTMFNWLIVGTLAFEIIYIAWQAGRGQLSHFNVSSVFYGTMYSLMALAASAATLAVAWMGWKFFTTDFPDLPVAYVWAIRIGLVLFVVFSFQGFTMGSRMAHTVGGPDGSEGLPIVNWSRRYGDLRIAHFIGMHALQVLPLLAFHLLKNVKLMLAVAVLYGALAVWSWALALKGKPLVRSRTITAETEISGPSESR